MNNLEELILDIFRFKFNIPKDKLKNSKNFYEDFDIDSFDMIDVILTIEHTFNISIDDEIVEVFFTIDDFVNYIRKVIEKKNIIL